MKDRFLIKLLASLAILKDNIKKQKECWEWEKKRCSDNKEEFVCNRFTLGRVTFIDNEVEKLIYRLMSDNGIKFLNCSDPVFNKVTNEIYETLAIENSKNKNAPACVIDDYRKDAIPPRMVDSWLCCFYTYKMINDRLQKTLERYNVDFKALDKAFDYYNKFFKKEIIAIEEA